MDVTGMVAIAVDMAAMLDMLDLLDMPGTLGTAEYIVLKQAHRTAMLDH